MGFLKAIFRAFANFYKNNGLINAASISYFSVMAIIPFCLLIITIFGHILGKNEELLIFFTEKLSHFFPKITHNIVEEVKKIIIYKGIGGLTLVIYIVLSYQLFSSAESAINIIFRIKSKRSIITSLLTSVFIISLVSILIVLSFFATTIISMFEMFKEYFPGIKISIIISFSIKYVIPFILFFLTMIVVYLFLPKVKIRIKPVIFGSLFVSIMFEIVKHFFTFYVVKVAKLGAIYGPISAFVIFLLWVFYSSSIFLVGAEIVHMLNTSRKRGR